MARLTTASTTKVTPRSSLTSKFAAREEKAALTLWVRPSLCLLPGMKSTPPVQIPQNNERFELHDAPGPGAQVVGKFATREAADEALAQKQKENPALEYIIADMGIRGPSIGNEEYIEAGKTAAQKQQEAALRDGADDPVRQSVETHRQPS